MSPIALSADAGLVALGLLTVNLILGLLLSVRCNPLRSWSRRRWNIFDLHNWTGYVALAAAALHPLPLLVSRRVPFGWAQIFWPVHAPQQPWANLMGALGLYLAGVVVLSSYLRMRLGRRNWKRIHFASYGAAILFFLHSLLLDPQLLNRPVDWMDAEKVYVEICFLMVVAGTLARWLYARRHPPRQRVTPGSGYLPGFSR